MRDSATARAALRLGARDYRRHREQGLGKLRTAIAGLVRGRVCEDHLDAVTLAATGDRVAAAELAAGPGRCRACAREAQRVRAIVHQRLAVAPAPLGPVAAALGAVKSLFGGGAAAAGMGAKAVATVAAVGVLAGGGAVAMVERDGTPAVRAERPPAVGAAPVIAAPANRAVDGQGSRRREAARTVRVRRAGSTGARAVKRTGSPAPATESPQVAVPERMERVADPVEATVERAERTAGDALPDLPAQLPESAAVERLVDDAAEDVGALVPRP